MAYRLNPFTKKLDIDTPPTWGPLDDRYVNVTGDTMTGDLNFPDDTKIYFDTAKTFYLDHNFDRGGITWGSDWLATIGNFTISSNVNEDGFGNFQPEIGFLSDGEAFIKNTLQGDVGHRFLAIEFTDGIRMRNAQSGYYAILKRGAITGSNKNFEFPNDSGILALQGKSVTTRVTTTYTILVTDEVVFADTDGGAFTATLPVGVEGQTLRIINVGSTGLDLTVDGNAAETVRGAATQIVSDSEIMILVYNATEGWW